MVCDEGADAMLDRSDTPGYNRSADAEDIDDEEVDEPEDKDKPELSPTAPSTLSAAVLPNPLYFEVVRSGATRHKTAVRPLLAMWARARRLLVCITPVLRHECEVLHTRGVTTAFAEVRHRSRKNVDNTAPVTAARRTVESDLRNLLETHSAQESAILADWADASGPLSARSESQLRAAMEKQERAQSHHEEVERLLAALRALQGVPPSDTTAGLRSSAASAAARKADGGPRLAETMWGSSKQPAAVNPASRHMPSSADVRGCDGEAEPTLDEEMDEVEEEAAAAAAVLSSAAGLSKAEVAVQRKTELAATAAARAAKTHALLARQLAAASAAAAVAADAVKVAREASARASVAAERPPLQAAARCGACHQLCIAVGCQRGACSAECCRLRTGQNAAAVCAMHTVE